MAVRNSVLRIAPRADEVIDWNRAALDAIRADRTPPPVASRALAMLHAAVYDAVNGISRTHETYRVPSTVPASASKEAAASAAAFRILAALFPASTARFGALHAKTVATIAEGPRRDAGLAWGEAVAVEILTWRLTDNADAMITPPVWTDPGAWQPTPPALASYLLPQWAFVQPFAMPTTRFRPAGPPDLAGGAYAEAYNEIKALGAAVNSARTAEQDLIALFWADGPGTENLRGTGTRLRRALHFNVPIPSNRTREFRAAESGHGGRRDLRLGCEVFLPQLASHHRYPQR